MRVISSLIVFLGCVIGLIIGSIAILFTTNPRIDNIRGCFKTSLYSVDLCPKSSSYTPLSQISKSVQMAVIMSEDGNFYTHAGFDWEEIQDSVEKNLEKHKFARGGSTLTQQLAKNLYLSKEKSLLRKLREAILVVQIERTLSKGEILEKYLNVVEFGPGIYGVKAAAQRYFSKSPANLTAVEGAWLAFLLPSPKKHSASFNKKALTPFARRQLLSILDRLNKSGKISDEEFASNQPESLSFLAGPAPVVADSGSNAEGDISNSSSADDESTSSEENEDTEGSTSEEAE